jgi:hypothetical protein
MSNSWPTDSSKRCSSDTVMSFGLRERQQVSVLARSFFSRFFENELTGVSTDVRHSFIWLIAALATPSFMMPIFKLGGWGIMAVTPGPEGGVEFLRKASAVDKVFVIAYTMASVGVLAAVVWQSLLVDRRDVLVLKTFPVRDSTLLAGKWGALAALLLVVSVAMHTPAAFFYGLLLGGWDGIIAAIRLAATHFVVLSAAGLFTFLSIVAAQGMLLAVVGPRLFARLGPALQLMLVAAAFGLMLASPMTAATASSAIYPSWISSLVAEPRSWVFAMPPLWFEGLYETLQGGLQGAALGVVHGLAARAVTALAASALLALVSYPLAYRRVMVEALVGTPISASAAPFSRALARRLPNLLIRDPTGQAIVQFVTATFGRASLQRLVIGMAAGIGVAINVSIVAANVGVRPAVPTAGLLAIPIVFILFGVAGIRIAMALPAELSAAWVFSTSTSGARSVYRTAVRRLLWLFVSVPAGLMVPVYGAMWGAGVACTHLLLCLAIGSLVTELALLGLNGVPCARAYEPGRAQLHSRWPLYFFLAVILAVEIPAFEAGAFRIHLLVGPAVLAALIAIAAAGARAWGNRRQLGPGITEERVEAVAGIVLH